MDEGSVKSYSTRPMSTSSQAIRVGLAVRGFSIIGGAPAINWRARRAARTTYANWLSGALVCTLISVFPPKRCQKFFYPPAAAQTRATQRGDDRFDVFSGPIHIIIDDDIVILAKGRNFVASAGQPPGDFVAGILSSACEPALQLFAGGRQNKDSHGFGQLLFYLRGALYVNFEHQVQSSGPGLLQPFLRSAVGMLAEYPGIFEEFAAGNQGAELGFRDEIIAFSARFGRAARPGRSEEHTSELQSHVNLVCRLLLEKKNSRTTHSPASPRSSPSR